MKHVKTFKKLVIFLLAFVMIFGVANVSAATTTYKKNGRRVGYYGSYYKVYYNNKLVSTAKKPAVMINDNIMIPYKRTLVNHGPKMTASMNKKTKTLTLKYGGKTIKFVVNKKYMYINGAKASLNTAPLYVRFSSTNRLMLPAKALCKAFGLSYTYNRSKKAVYISTPVSKTTSSSSSSASTSTSTSKTTSTSSSKLTAASFKSMTTAQFIKTLGPIARENYKATGVLASVTLAQAINESGWGKSALAQKSNNLFGMKISLSGNTWAGSAWDGKSYVSVSTTEEYSGKKVTITAKFRKYNTVAESIADHSAYLVNAKNGLKNRYAGLTSTTSYTKQLQILQTGGYCTWSGYKIELSNLIKKYNLTQYDK